MMARLVLRSYWEKKEHISVCRTLSGFYLTLMYKESQYSCIALASSPHLKATLQILSSNVTIKSNTKSQLPEHAVITAYSASPYPASSQRHKEITNTITYHLAKDLAPINTVQNKGLKKMIKTLDKHFSVPSRNCAMCITLRQQRIYSQALLQNHR